VVEIGKLEAEPSPSNIVDCPNPTPLDPDGIILADTTVMKQVDKLKAKEDPWMLLIRV